MRLQEEIGFKFGVENSTEEGNDSTGEWVSGS
jgi:hypothetical protein